MQSLQEFALVSSSGPLWCWPGIGRIYIDQDKGPMVAQHNPALHTTLHCMVSQLFTARNTCANTFSQILRQTSPHVQTHFLKSCAKHRHMCKRIFSNFAPNIATCANAFSQILRQTSPHVQTHFLKFCAKHRHMCKRIFSNLAPNIATCANAFSQILRQTSPHVQTHFLKCCAKITFICVVRLRRHGCDRLVAMIDNPCICKS